MEWRKETLTAFFQLIATDRTTRDSARRISVLLFALTILGPCNRGSADNNFVDVQDNDKFSKTITLVGPQEDDNKNLRLWLLRSFVDKKTGDATHQVYVHVASFAGYERASDEDAEDLPFSKIGLISSGGETFGIEVKADALLAHAASGYSIKAYAKNGDSFILTLTPIQINAQLSATAKYHPLSPEEKARLDEQARIALQKKTDDEAALRPFSSRLPSLTSFFNGGVFYPSIEPSSQPGLQSKAVMGVVCRQGAMSVVVAPDFKIKKAFNPIGPTITDVRYFFDADDFHRNWERFSESEAGPMGTPGMLNGFVQSIASNHILKVSFNRDDSSDRDMISFDLSDSARRAAILELIGQCGR